MFKILDRYIYKTFLPLFAMSLVVCWFLVVMQFLWRYVDELVGKGMGMFVLGKIIFYAAFTFLPMAMPLGILLASLMTFGNLGERLELLSMKAAGMPLYRIMRPLFLLVAAMSAGLFFFQNDFMINAQVQMWNLVLSAKTAAPELEIPPGVFYTGIPGYSLYAKERLPENGQLRQLMVYDMSKGYLNPRIIRADSGRLVMDKSKKFLVLKLYNGQSYENLRAQTYNTSTEPVPYMLPHFAYSETFIPYNANFSVQDEKQLGGLYITKNLAQLSKAIDSTALVIDSTRSYYATAVTRDLAAAHYQGFSYPALDSADERRRHEELQRLSERMAGSTIDGDSLLELTTLGDSLRIVTGALNRLEQQQGQASYFRDDDEATFYAYRTFRQEWHRKFTTCVACLIFFLIGAPLGAIVRRGGIGMPVIVSIFFFIIYYSIDSLGTNMLRSGDLPVWLGMWLSNIVLLPVGIYLSYQANRDSAALNAEAYLIFFRRLMGTLGVRQVVYQDLTLEETDYKEGMRHITKALALTKELRQSPQLSAPTPKLWLQGGRFPELEQLSQQLDQIVEGLHHSRDRLLVGKLNDLPLLPDRISRFLPRRQLYARILGALLPLSLPLSLLIRSNRRHLKGDLDTTYYSLQTLSELTAKAASCEAEAKLPPVQDEPSPTTEDHIYSMQ